MRKNFKKQILKKIDEKIIQNKKNSDENFLYPKQKKGSDKKLLHPKQKNSDEKNCKKSFCNKETPPGRPVSGAPPRCTEPLRRCRGVALPAALRLPTAARPPRRRVTTPPPASRLHP